jgi:hypothetical protein
MAINTIDIGATANDGTGDAIRDAFDTVNQNFSFVQGGLFAGTESSIISALSVTGGVIVSNTSVTAVTTTSNSVVVTGHAGGNLFVQSNGATIIGNVNIVGNLNVSGSQTSTASQATDAAMINLHYSATPPLTIDDGKDIGLAFKYYKGAERQGFLGWQNTTRSLVYMDNTTEVGNVITAGTFGNVQFGQLLISNTTNATSNITGALQVKGGVGIAGNLFADRANIGNVSITGFHVGNMNFAGGDTIYINGSPVQTAATAFNGGTVGLTTLFACTTPSTSTTTGAVRITGGLGVAGNTFMSNLQIANSGNVRANLIGTVFTSSQPQITNLGSLTTLSVAGQTTARDIVPEADLTYQIGTSGSTRWSKIWTFDIDMSGVLTGGTVNSTGGAHSGNLAINTSTAAGLATTTPVAELFETNASTVRIGGGGQTQFRNNTQSSSTTSGAVIIQGGVGIATGQLWVGGTGGRSITTTTGNVVILGNTQSFSTNHGQLVVGGGVAIASGNLYISGSGGHAIVATGNIIPSGNVVATNNLGSDTAWWNAFYGRSVQAQYADLAENYVADDNYSPATVVIFGGDQEITTTTTYADTRVAGVISSNPAYLMNAATPGLPVALRGRVPVQVLGPVSKGDLLVTSTQPGFAQSVGQVNSFGHAVFAKSLTTDGRNGSKIIEAVIL